MTRTIFVIVLLSVTLLAQPPYSETYQKQFLRNEYPQKIPVLFRPYPVYQGQDRYLVTIPVEINYDYLQFVRDESRYYAGAEIEMIFTDKKKNFTRTKIWQSELTVSDFRTTQNRSLWHFTEDSLLLPPGQYEVIFKYRDVNGEQRVSFRRKLVLKPEELFMAAPPLFFDPAAGGTSRLLSGEGRPSPLSMNWDFNHDLGVQMRSWQSDSTQAVEAGLEVMDGGDGHTLFAFDTTFQAPGVMREWSVIVPGKLFQEGAFRIKATYHFGSDSSRQIVPFKVTWFSKPKSMWDYDLSLRPLKYILDKEQFDELSSGNREEQQAKLDAFWKKMDPTSDTPFNELQYEFYTRVDSSLKNFSTRRQPGWQTDLGKVYISNGPPHKVEDHSLDPVPQPFLRWIYFQGDKRMIYTFRAIDGRKEFQLIDAEESNL